LTTVTVPHLRRPLGGGDSGAGELHTFGWRWTVSTGPRRTPVMLESSFLTTTAPVPRETVYTLTVNNVTGQPVEH